MSWGLKQRAIFAAVWAHLETVLVLILLFISCCISKTHPSLKCSIICFVILCKYPECVCVVCACACVCVFLHASIKAVWSLKARSDETSDNTLNEMLSFFSVSECMFKVYYIIRCGHRLTRSCLSRLESIHEIFMLEKKVNLTFFLTEHGLAYKRVCISDGLFLQPRTTSIKLFCYFIKVEPLYFDAVCFFSFLSVCS